MVLITDRPDGFPEYVGKRRLCQSHWLHNLFVLGDSMHRYPLSTIYPGQAKTQDMVMSSPAISYRHRFRCRLQSEHRV